MADERPLDYWPAYASIRRHGKTRKLRRLLADEFGTYSTIKPHWLIGELYYEATEQYPDGVLRDLEAHELADIAGWPGDEQRFGQALIDAGWIKEVSGQLVLVNWMEYAGRVIGRRAKARNRQKRWRESRVDNSQQGCDSRDNNALVTRDSNGSNGAVTVKYAQRESKSKRESNIETDEQSSSLSRVNRDGSISSQNESLFPGSLDDPSMENRNKGVQKNRKRRNSPSKSPKFGRITGRTTQAPHQNSQATARNTTEYGTDYRIVTPLTN